MKSAIELGQVGMKGKVALTGWLRRVLWISGAVVSLACSSDTVAPAGTGGSDVPASVETAGGDAAPDCNATPRPSTCPCEADDQCASGSCNQGRDGAACAVTCDGTSDCPESLFCLPGNAGSAQLCFDASTIVGRPCQDATACTLDGASPDVVVCASYGADGSFCAVACATTADCPEGDECTDTGDAKACMKVNAADLPCDDAWVTAGLETVCFVENADGKCLGSRTCDVACDAATPAAEACNGKDDDCDGETDEGFPDQDGDSQADCADCDLDGDSVSNEGAGCPAPTPADNCPTTPNSDQKDTDSDGQGDACDTVAPTAPTLTGAQPGSPSNVLTPAILGSTEKGATIRLFTTSNCSGDVVGEGTAGDDGAFSIEVTAAENDDTTFWAHALDGAGNVSPCSSSSVVYQHDGIAPVEPILLGSTPVSPSQTITTPLVQGLAESGGVVALHATADCTDAALAVGDVVNGSFSVVVQVPANTVTTLHATVTDAAGNTSACSASSYLYVHDDQAPPAPVLLITLPLSPSNSLTPTVEGTGEPLATIQLFTNAACSGTQIAVGAADASGGFAILVGVPANLNIAIHARAVDAAGNPSACSVDPLAYDHDGTAPQPPAFTGTAPVSPSNDIQPKILGIAEAGAIVTLYTTTNCAGAIAGIGQAVADGAFAADVTVTEAGTTTFYGKATDVAGNDSFCSAAGQVFVHDISIPSAPTFASSIPASPSSTNTTPTVLGTTVALGTIDLFTNDDCSGDAVATTTALGDGTFTVTITVPANETTSIRATVTSPSGNVSGCSAPFVYTHDAIAPLSPILSGTTPVGPASVAAPSVLGTAEALSVVSVYGSAGCTGTPLATATAAADGSVTVASVPATPNALTNFHATARDAAGNESACSSSVAAYVHDDIAPDEATFIGTTPPSPTKLVTTPFLTGIATPGTRVLVYATPDCSGDELASQLSADGAFSIKVTVPVNSTTVFHAVTVDTAGNRSACSSSTIEFVHDASAPAAPALLATSPLSPSKNPNPTVSGTAEAGTTVKLYKASGCAGSVIATTDADGDGAFSVLVGITTNATTTLYARATDVAGNTSECSVVSLAYTHDDIAPDSIAFTSTVPPSPSNVLTPELVGTAEAGASVTVYTTTNCSGAAAGVATAGADGVFAVPVAVSVGSSSTFYGRATDAAGNASICSATGSSYVHDVATPPAPVLVSTTPTSPSKSSTTPTVVGTAIPNATIDLFTTASCSGAPAMTGSSNGAGAFSISVAVSANSATTLYARATSGSGNASACSTGLTYVHDAVAPLAPTVSSTTPASPGNVLDVTISGTAEALSVVSVYRNASCTGSAIATASADADGNYAVASAPIVANTSNTLSVKAADAAGNVSPCSTQTLTYLHDGNPPSAPIFIGSTPASPSQTITTPFLTGSAEAGSTVEIHGTTDCSGAVLATASAAGGSFSVLVNVGSNTTTRFHAIAVDAAGNRSVCSASELVYRHDSLSPGAATITSTDPASPSDNANPTVVGVAEPLAEVKIYKAADCSGSAVTTTADASGAFSVLVAVALNTITNLHATARDASGNLSTCSSTAFPFLHDSTDPAPPELTGTTPPSPSNSLSPKVVGTTEGGATVKLYKVSNCTGTVAGSGVADAAGAFSVDVAVTANTTTTWWATATDKAGNVSACTASGRAYVHDAFVPEAPTLTGTTPASPSKSVTTPAVDGSALAGGTVKIYSTLDCSGAVLGTGVVGGDGRFSVPVTVASASTTTFRATVSTTAGNTSTCSSSSTVYIHDPNPPVAPVVVASLPASPSNVIAPSVSGTAEAKSMVAIFSSATCAGAPLASAAAAADGAFTVTGVTVSPNTTTTLYARATDAAGNASPCSGTSVSYLHDAIAPAQAVFIGTTPSSPSSVVTTPFLAGTADAGSKVTVYANLDCLGTPAGTQTVGLDGTFNIKVTVPPNSSTVFKAVTTDAAGNPSACSSSSVTYRHDDQAPAAPQLIGSDPTSPSNVLTPTLLGSTEAGVAVTVYKAAGCTGSAAASGQADEGGLFAVLVPVSANTTTSLYAKVVDGAGNASGCSPAFEYRHDASAPLSPTLTGTTPPSPANKLDPNVNGTTEAGATVKLYAGAGCSGVAIATGAADANGAFSVKITVGVASTTLVSATSTDVAGNTSTCTPTTLTYVHDNNLPGAPVITGSSPATPSKTSTSPTLQGTSAIGGTVKLYADADCAGPVAGQGPVSAGTFAIGVTVTANSSTAFRATVTSIAGNTSPCSAPFTYVHDSTAPDAPVGLSLNPASPSNDPAPSASVSAEPGATVAIFKAAGCSGAALGTAVVPVSGSVVVSGLAVTKNAKTTLSARATDPAGNASACSNSVEYLHDDVVPSAPVLSGTSPVSPSTTNTLPIVSGTAELGSTVSVFVTGDCQGASAGTQLAANGSFSFPVTVASNRATSLSAVTTDPAGNVSGCSNVLTYVHDSEAPTTPTELATTPASPANVSTPLVVGKAESGNEVALYTSATCTGTPVASGPVSETGNFAILAAALTTPATGATTTWYARARDAAGNGSPCSPGLSYVFDGGAPVSPTLTSTSPASPSRTTTSPQVTGAAEPFGTVRLYTVSNCSGTAAGQATANASGAFTATVNAGVLVPVANVATVSLYASTTDAAGNTSACSTPALVYTYDAAAPNKPSVELPTSTLLAPVQNTTIAVNVASESGATVRLYQGAGCPNCAGTPFATQSIESGSVTSFSGITVVGTGSTVFCASSTDVAGNGPVCSNAVTYYSDNTKPAAPIMTGSDPVSPSKTGSAPKIQGSAEAGSTVALYKSTDCSGALANQGTAAVNGLFEIGTTVSANQTTFFTARTTDAAGNVSDCSSTNTDPAKRQVTYRWDTLVPAAPVFTGPASPSNDAEPAIVGTVGSGGVEAGASVALFTDSTCSQTAKTAAGAAAAGTVSATGTFDVEVKIAATTTFYGKATDVAGNVSPCSTTGWAYTYDPSTPAAPVLTETTPLSPGNVTAVTVKGTSTATGTLKLFKNGTCPGGTVIATKPHGTAGAFTLSVTVDDTAQPSTTNFQATVTSGAGTSSPCSNVLGYVYDKVAPGAPTLTSTTPSTTLDPSNVALPTVNGATEADATIKIYSGSCPAGPQVGSATADAAGAFTAEAVTVGADVTQTLVTTNLYARATDKAGNVGACSALLAYRFDGKAPAVPSNLSVTAAGTPTSPTVQGSTEPGSYVFVYIGTCDGSPVNPEDLPWTNGPFTVPVTVAAGSKTSFVVRARDAAGNLSPCSAPVVYDLEAPAGPVLTGTTPSSPGNDETPAVAGTVATDVVKVIFYAASDCGGTAVGETTSISLGFFSGSVLAIPNGATRTFWAKAFDAANNASSCSTSSVSYLYDGTAPTTPIFTVVPGGGNPDPAGGPSEDATPMLRANVESTATCDFYQGVSNCTGTPVATNIASVLGASEFELTTPLTAQGTTSFSVRCRDTASNPTSCVPAVYVFDTLPPVFDAGSLSANVLGLAATLSWPSATDANGPVSYELCGSTTPTAPPVNCTAILSSTLAGTSIGVPTVGALDPATRYYFTVRARDAAGNVSATLPATFKTAGYDVAVDVGQGGTHSCALLVDGTVRCWGNNSSGNLGNGTTVDALSPVTVTGGGGYTAIAVGSSFNCGLLADGTVKCWGSDLYAQLGRGADDSPNNSTPGPVLGLPSQVGVRSIAAGSYHACAVLTDGRVFCWGRNSQGQCGQATSDLEIESATQVPVVTGAVALAAGSAHTCALLQSGEMRCWGDNSDYQLGIGALTALSGDYPTPQPVVIALGGANFGGVSRIDAGGNTTCAVTVGGTVYCWGDNALGQAGAKSSSTKLGVPTVGKTGGGSDFVEAVDVAVGGSSVCVQRYTGSVSCAGSNEEGQLARPATVTSTNYFSGSNTDGIRAIHMSFDGGCVVRTNGVVACFGDNFSGEGGTGAAGPDLFALTNLPATANDAMSAPSNALSVTSGARHTCGVLVTGQVACWGDNTDGQLGINNATVASNLYPQLLGTPTNVVQVAAGIGFTCALTGKGEVYCWGQNDRGQCATAAGADVLAPTVVKDGGVNLTASAIAVGDSFACALSSGVVKCWGAGSSGKLGDGGDQDSATPVTVVATTGALAPVRALTAGGSHSCALTQTGEIWCWGENGDGQIGNNSQVDAEVATKVVGFSVARWSIAAGGAFTCAGNSDSVYCWGRGTEGQLANAKDTSHSSVAPANVAINLNSVLSLQGGYRHGCAYESGGKVKCWGANVGGELGDGTTVERTAPVFAVSSGARGVFSGPSSQTSCAILSDGKVSCWGENGNGQVGVQTVTDVLTPTGLLVFP